MKVSLDFLVRIGGMLALAYLGSEIGKSLSRPFPDDRQLLATQLLMLAGAGLGLIVTPRLTIVPIRALLQHTRSVPLEELVFLTIGGLIGVIFGVLLSVPLSMLPAPLNQYLPIVCTVIAIYITTMTFALHKRSLPDIMRQLRRPKPTTMPLNPPTTTTGLLPTPRNYLVDTSAIIDGRIAKIGETGFLDGTLLVPQFVLIELQTLADSSDELRRSKGRRGLDLLTQMQKESSLPVEVVDIDVNGVVRVDDKLVMVARQYQCPIITNDFNLNRVAELQGVKVLSLNFLSDAIRPAIVQDQRLEVLIRNEGNARQQGVGYLADGTPVIVEDARHLIGKQVEVIVTRLHQTQTGRLVFAHLDNKAAETKQEHPERKRGNKQ
jgi:uncharacterized protein YacL